MITAFNKIQYRKKNKKITVAINFLLITKFAFYFFESNYDSWLNDSKKQWLTMNVRVLLSRKRLYN